MIEATIAILEREEVSEFCTSFDMDDIMDNIISLWEDFEQSLGGANDRNNLRLEEDRQSVGCLRTNGPKI